MFPLPLKVDSVFPDAAGTLPVNVNPFTTYIYYTHLLVTSNGLG